MILALVNAIYAIAYYKSLKSLNPWPRDTGVML